MDGSMSGLHIPHHLPEFAQVHVHYIGDAVQPSHPLTPSIFPSIRDFSNKSSVLIRWPQYWRFSISPSSEYSGLISFKIDWFDFLAVQGTCRSLLQHHQLEGINSLSFCLLYSPAVTAICDHWEDHSLDYMDICQRVISLLFTTLSRFVIAFLPRSNHLLISWL